MKTILVPIDFSELANAAVEVACHLAKKSASRLVVLHVIETPSSSSFNPECSLELRHEDLNGNESVRFLGFSVAPLRLIQKTHSVTDLKSVKSGIDFLMDILGLM